MFLFKEKEKDGGMVIIRNGKSWWYSCSVCGYETGSTELWKIHVEVGCHIPTKRTSGFIINGPDLKGVNMVEEQKAKGEKPSIRLVQVTEDKDGKKQFNSVGGLWEHQDKNKKTYYTVSIGNLRLLGYPNDK